MRRPLSLALLLLAASLSAGAQWIRLGRPDKQVRLTVDLVDRLWDYNRYEGSRWGLGLGVDMPLCQDRMKPRVEQRRFAADVWAGYGVRDKAWKYGASARFDFPHGLPDRVYLGFKDDLERAGNRSLRAYSPLEVWNNPGFLSDQYVRVRRGWVGVEASTRRQRFDLSCRLGRETLLCLDSMPAATLGELRLVWTLNRMLTLDLMWGQRLDAAPARHYLRLLGQFSGQSQARRWGQAGAFAQAGFVTDEAPLQRRFDLGGTYNSGIYFRNTFLTVAPEARLNRSFALAFLAYSTPAFYHSRVSNPRLFAQAGAMVGEQDYRQGLAEVAVGIDRIIRWGLLDLGVAAAFQLTPPSAPYHQADPRRRFAVAGVATLIFEQ